MCPCASEKILVGRDFAARRAISLTDSSTVLQSSAGISEDGERGAQLTASHGDKFQWEERKAEMIYTVSCQRFGQLMRAILVVYPPAIVCSPGEPQCCHVEKSR